MSAPGARWWRSLAGQLGPAAPTTDVRERVRIAIGATLGLLLTGLVCRAAGGGIGLVGALGASAVLVFGVPASPLAQPWSVVGGNFFSAWAGILCVRLFPDPVIAGSVAVGVALGLMLSLRCLHPPGGGVALIAGLGGTTSLAFPFFPVLLNSLLLVAFAAAYNTRTGRRYPHPQAKPKSAGPRFSDADFDAALLRYNQVLDIARDDLQDLFEQAEIVAHRRRMREWRCDAIMSREPATVEFGDGLQPAWDLLQRRRVKALPVVDRARRIVGIVTLADFMRHAGGGELGGFDGRLRGLLRASPGVESSKPEVVGQIMTREVRVVSADRSLAEVAPIFASTGHHHLPVIDAERRLVGIVTPKDLIAALAGDQPL